jgi:hypothetical protein
VAFGGWLGEPRPRWRLIGLAGSALLAAGAVGVGVHPRPDPWAALDPVWALRHEPLGVAASLAAAGVGVALLVLAWARLRGHVEALAEETSAAAAVRWWWVTTGLWALPLAIAPPMFSRDVYSYAAQGEIAVAGLDPYADGPSVLTSSWLESVSPAWRDTPAPYGPLFLLLAQGVVWLSAGNLVVAVLLLRTVAIAGLALVGVYVPRLARNLGVSPRSAVWLGLASPLLVLHAVSGAHNDALMLGLVVAGLACAVERRVAVGLVLLALAAAVKATALVVVPFAALLWVARMPSPRPVLRLVQACAAAVAVVGAAFGAVTLAGGFGVGWVGALETPGRSIQWTSLPTGLGMAIGWTANAVGLGVDTGVTVAVCRVVGMAAMLAVLVWLWWSVRGGGDAPDARRVVEHAGWALLAVALLSPAFHPWYLPTAVTVLAVAAVRRRVVVGLAVASGALCFLVLPDGFNLARVTVPAGAALDVAVLVAGSAVWARWLVRRRQRRRTAAIVMTSALLGRSWPATRSASAPGMSSEDIDPS